VSFMWILMCVSRRKIDYALLVGVQIWEKNLAAVKPSFAGVSWLCWVKEEIVTCCVYMLLSDKIIQCREGQPIRVVKGVVVKAATKNPLWKYVM